MRMMDDKRIEQLADTIWQSWGWGGSLGGARELARYILARLPASPPLSIDEATMERVARSCEGEPITGKIPFTLAAIRAVLAYLGVQVTTDDLAPWEAKAWEVLALQYEAMGSLYTAKQIRDRDGNLRPQMLVIARALRDAKGGAS